MEAAVVVAIVLPWTFVVAQAVLIYRLIQAHGKVLVSEDQVTSAVSGVETQTWGNSPSHEEPSVPPAALLPPGLPVGAQAPDFALPNLEGRKRALADFAGRPFVVAFFDATCRFCQAMAPRLGVLPPDALPIVLIGFGDAAEYRRLADTNGWDCEVLVAPNLDTFADYKASGTPIAYAVDAEGRIATELAAGADDVLSLASSGGRSNGGPAVEQQGLAAGTAAPEFTLPDLEGAERSLSEFRGKRILLVFSDITGCASCDQLSPRLAALHATRRADVEVVMVGRGSAEVNRERAASSGLTFPVLTERDNEVSTSYAAFSIPAAYLIDEEGFIAKGPARETNEILQLA